MSLDSVCKRQRLILIGSDDAPITTSITHTTDLVQLDMSVTVVDGSSSRSSASSSATTVIAIIPPCSMSLVFAFLNTIELLDRVTIVCREWLRVLRKSTTWNHFSYHGPISRFPDISKSTIISTNNIRDINIKHCNATDNWIINDNRSMSEFINTAVPSLQKLKLHYVHGQVYSSVPCLVITLILLQIICKS